MARKDQQDTRSVMLAPNAQLAFDDPRMPYSRGCYASPKFDGNRCFVRGDGQVLSRSMKLFPNKVHFPAFMRPIAEFCKSHAICLDGEILITDASHHGQHGVIMDHDAEMPDSLVYRVFDAFSLDEWDGRETFAPFVERVQLYTSLVKDLGYDCCEAVTQTRVKNAAEAEAFFRKCADEGYEGCMFRAGDGLYKQSSRATHKQAWLLKKKVTETLDAKIIEVEQGLQMREGIARERNAMGRSIQPTKNADNYRPIERAGSFLCVDEKGRKSRLMFAAGVADMAQRDKWWKERKSLVGKWLEFKAVPGGKDGIRSGMMLRFRPDLDQDGKPAGKKKGGK